MSVHTRSMNGDGPIVLLAELMASTADAHSPRAIVRAIATTLAARMSITRVELRAPAPSATAVLSQGEWRCVDSGSPTPAARLLATGLAVVPSAALPDFCSGTEFREALGQVVAAATRHV